MRCSAGADASSGRVGRAPSFRNGPRRIDVDMLDLAGPDGGRRSDPSAPAPVGTPLRARARSRSSRRDWRHPATGESGGGAPARRYRAGRGSENGPSRLTPPSSRPSGSLAPRPAWTRSSTRCPGDGDSATTPPRAPDRLGLLLRVRRARAPRPGNGGWRSCALSTHSQAQVAQRFVARDPARQKGNPGRLVVEPPEDAVSAALLELGSSAITAIRRRRGSCPRPRLGRLQLAHRQRPLAPGGTPPRNRSAPHPRGPRSEPASASAVATEPVELRGPCPALRSRIPIASSETRRAFEKTALRGS